MSISLTYKTCIKGARDTFFAHQKVLKSHIAQLSTNITSLDAFVPPTRPYEEIKAELQHLNSQMVTYYANELPTVRAAQQIGREALVKLDAAFIFFNQLCPLTPAVIEHLRRQGADVNKIEQKEQSWGGKKKELKDYMTHLNKYIYTINALSGTFAKILNQTLKIQAEAAEITNDRQSRIDYPYLNDALVQLQQKQDPEEKEAEEA